MQMIDTQKVIRVLVGIIIVLIVFIVAGTIFALVVRPQQKSRLKTVAQVSLPDFEEELFGDIGRLRLTTAHEPPLSVILTPIIEYPVDDVPAREELVEKKEALRESCRAWFSSQSAEALSNMDDEKIKAELIADFNKLLSLQKIEKIYFKEYMILK